MATWLKEYETLWVGSPHSKSPPAKYGGHRYCGHKDLIFLISHVISKDHVTPELFDITARSNAR